MAALPPLPVCEGHRELAVQPFGARFLTRILVRRPDSNRLRHLGSGVVIGAIGGRYAIVASAAHALQARWNEAAFGTNWGSKRSTEVGMKHTLIALVALALSACSSYA